MMVHSLVSISHSRSFERVGNKDIALYLDDRCAGVPGICIYKDYLCKFPLDLKMSSWDYIKNFCPAMAYLKVR